MTPEERKELVGLTQAAVAVEIAAALTSIEESLERIEARLRGVEQPDGDDLGTKILQAKRRIRAEAPGESGAGEGAGAGPKGTGD